MSRSQVYQAQSANSNSALFLREFEVVEDSEPEREALRPSPLEATVCSQPEEAAWDLDRDTRSLPSIIELTSDEEDGIRCAQLHAVALVPSAPSCTKSALSEGPISSVSTQEDASEEENVIELRGFAYLAAQPPINAASSGAGASGLPRTGSSRSLEPKPKKRNRANLFVDDLPSDHVAKLTKCVSCGARWTTRKSASQKTKHIQSCARKKSFTPDTIRIALSKEVEHVKAMNKSARKDKEPNPSENTLLENTVKAAAKGKRTRHAKKTVESITVTRNSILDRAKQILAYPSDNGGTDLHEDGELPMPSTQPFGQSALEEQCLLKTKLFTEASANSPARSRTPFADNYDKSALTYHDSDISVISDLDITGQCDRRKEKEAVTEAANRIIGEVGLERRGVHDQNNVDSPGTDEQWTHQFRSLIIQDRDLHLSILRYEPVHFNVFKELARASSLVKIKSKISLQTFLDAEGIHYHGTEPSDSQIKRH